MALYDVTNLSVLPGNLLALVLWDAPANIGSAMFRYTMVRYATDAFPDSISDGYLLENVSGSGEQGAVHSNIENGTSYYYSLFSVYEVGSGSYTYYGPYSTGPVVPDSSEQFFTELEVSFTKLGFNTKLYGAAQKYYTTDMIVWLASGMDEYKESIIDFLNSVKPAHTKIRIFWEPYYAALTTTEQLSALSFDSSVYIVENGTLINSVPTIDSSFDGLASL